MVVTLYGCYERTCPLSRPASLFVWQDGACLVYWRFAIIPQPSLSLHIRTNILFRLDTFHPSFSVSSSHSSFAFTVLSCSIFVAMGLALFRHWRVVGICQLALSVWVNCTVEPFIAVGLNAHWGSSWYDCFLMTERLSHRCKALLFFIIAVVRNWLII